MGDLELRGNLKHVLSVLLAFLLTFERDHVEAMRQHGIAMKEHASRKAAHDELVRFQKKRKRKGHLTAELCSQGAALRVHAVTVCTGVCTTYQGAQMSTRYE